MTTWARRVAALCILSAAAACGGGSDEGEEGAGGSGGGDTSCDGVCDSLFAQGCFYAGGEQDCRTSCNGWETQYVETGPDYCQAAWADYKACITSETLTCTGVADWNAMPCRGHWDHFQGYCINRNATPDTACMQNAAWDSYCMDAAKPRGNLCMGDVPAGCVIAGTNNNASLYCCP